MFLTERAGAADQSHLLTGPLHIAVDVTNKCNAKCLHCYNRSGGLLERDELSDDELISLYKDLAAFKPFSSCFCGGEPMIRFPILVEAIKILKERHVHGLAMVSNGWFITDEKAKDLVDAGLGSVQISVDGARAETHEFMRGVPGLFSKAMGAIGIFSDLGIPVQIAFSPTKFNVHEFKDLIEILSDFDRVVELRVQPLMPMGNAIAADDELFPSDSDYRELVRTIREIKDSGRYSLNIEWGDPLDHIVRFSKYGFKNSSYLEVKSNGDICVSAYLPLTIGNVRKHSVREYWNAGIGQAWRLPIVQDMAARIVSIGDMRLNEGSIPKTFYEDHISIDFIDDDVLSHPMDFTLEKFAKER